MNEFLNRLQHSWAWFIGTIIVLFILVLLIWRAIDPNDFRIAVNNFFEDLWAIFWQLLALAFAVLGILMMFGFKPFGKKKGH